MLQLETEVEKDNERRRRAETSAQKLSPTLSSLQTDHSHLLNLHNTVVPSPPHSQPDAVTNKGLFHGFPQLRRLLLHKQHETDFLAVAMRDRIQSETANTNQASNQSSTKWLLGRGCLKLETGQNRKQEACWTILVPLPKQS